MHKTKRNDYYYDDDDDRYCTFSCSSSHNIPFSQPNKKLRVGNSQPQGLIKLIHQLCCENHH